MTTDPRLRLLSGTDASSVAPQVLRALDGTRVVVRTGPDMTGAHTAALAAFVVMTARLFGDVILGPPVTLAPNWWDASDTTALLTVLDPVRPHPAEQSSLDVVVTFGAHVDPGSWGIGGDDYTVRLGRDPQPLGPMSTHAFGVHAAACLAVSQLLVETLGPLGFSGVALDGPYVMNLVDYTLTPTPERPAGASGSSTDGPLPLAVAGVGSVGTSALALLATALSPALAPAGLPGAGTIAEVVAVDADTIDPHRNPFRYPALLGTESGHKAVYFAERLTALGLPAQGHPVTVAEWTRGRDQPGFDGLLLSSVDTLGGRLDVTDVLSRTTLSLGVSGLALHAQREAFADGFACPFCDYVSADPPLTQADVHAQTTGLPVARVLALLQEGTRLASADVDVAIAAGKLSPDRRAQLVGAPLSDLVRQAYAEIELHASSRPSQGGDVVTVAAPQVSWFAGVLAAVEIVKQLRGLALLDRRVDVDLSGLPPGLVRRPAADTTGRCLCRSGTRIRWYRVLYDTNTGGTADGRDTDVAEVP